MNKLFNKRIISNVIFGLAIVLLLYPPTREWGMRQIAFAPSIKKIENTERIGSYHCNLEGLNSPNLNFNKFENKIVFVNFWATWCPPCRAEMPMIQNLYNDYKGKIAFVFVTNENWATVEEFYKKYSYSLPSYNSISLPPKELTKTNSIPASYLIDQKGNIIISKTGAANWNSNKVRKLIDDLLKE